MKKFYLLITVICIVTKLTLAQELNSPEYRLQLNQSEIATSPKSTSENYSLTPLQNNSTQKQTYSETKPLESTIKQDSASSTTLSISKDTIDLNKTSANSFENTLELKVTGKGNELYKLAIGKANPFQTPDSKIVLTDTFCLKTYCEPTKATAWTSQLQYGLGYTTVSLEDKNQMQNLYYPLSDLKKNSPVVFSKSLDSKLKLNFKSVLNPSAFEQSFITTVVIYAFPDL